MRISYNWLKQYININLNSKELEEKLTFSGIEVESIENIGEELKQIIIGKIVEKTGHPQADKLSICQVDDGTDIKQVICGAPNCEKNQKIAFAPVGSKLGEFKIKKVKLRGKESYGMICSEQELGISDNHDGIMILPDDAPTGKNLASYLNLADTSYELEITPNRPDLLGMIGVARDLSALLKLPLNLPKISLKPGKKKIEEALALENEAPELCSRYVARMIEGVTICESPQWLKKRLLAVGLRPINNVVDITNFVMMEYGHPLHAFDYQNLDGKKIIVRRAKKEEKIPALDEETYTLEESDLVIADASKPIAIAGIIGGENSHITSQTTNIVLEAANFNYANIRRTSRKLKISTDSSYRFERNLSDETAEIVSKRAAQLILEIAGGTLLQGTLDSYPNPQKTSIVALRPSRVRKFLTIKEDDKTLINYLEGLELKLQKQETDKLYFEIPFFRKDLTREIDLIEEIIRLHGYNNVETFHKSQNIMNKRSFYARRKLQDILVSSGFCEVINWSFADPKDLDSLNIPESDERRNVAKIKNPLGNDFAIMRSTLLPGIFKNTLLNIYHGQKELKLFEMNKVFFRKDEKLATEKYNLTGLLTGNLNPVFWKEKPKEIDFYDVKGIVEELLTSLDLEDVDYITSKENYFQPGSGADIIFRENCIGNFGKLDPKIAQTFGLEQTIFIFELSVDDIFSLQEKLTPTYKSIAKFPPVLRDLSFVISKEFMLKDIKNIIFKTNPKIIKNVVLFDEFISDKIKEGYRSLTFSLVFSSETKTLTDEFINNLLKTIIANLEKSCNIEMR